jgi:hypothetical protein
MYFHLVYHLRLPTRTFLRPTLCDSFTFLHLPASRRTTRQHSGPDLRIYILRSALCSAPPPLSSCPPPGRPAEPDTFVRHFASLRVPPFATLRCFPGPQYTTTALPSLPPFCGFPPSPPLPPAAAQQSQMFSERRRSSAAFRARYILPPFSAACSASFASPPPFVPPPPPATAQQMQTSSLAASRRICTRHPHDTRLLCF